VILLISERCSEGIRLLGAARSGRGGLDTLLLGVISIEETEPTFLLLTEPISITGIEEDLTVETEIQHVESPRPEAVARCIQQACMVIEQPTTEEIMIDCLSDPADLSEVGVEQPTHFLSRSLDKPIGSVEISV
jgi:hypothetical protein